MTQGDRPGTGRPRCTVCKHLHYTYARDNYRCPLCPCAACPHVWRNIYITEMGQKLQRCYKCLAERWIFARKWQGAV